MIDSDIIKQATVIQMVESFDKASELIRRGFNLFEQAEQLLKEGFIPTHCYFNVLSRYEHPHSAEISIRRIETEGWKQILDKMGIQKIISAKRKQELDNQLEKHEMPPLTYTEIMAFVKMCMGNTPAMIKELAKEAYEVLMPGRGHGHWKTGHYKTNIKHATYALGKGVIIQNIIGRYYCPDDKMVNSQSEHLLVVVDKVFHILDGKSILNEGSYRSPLVDAINTAEDGKGKTEYFKFKACKNRNLHLTFLRIDLVKMLNEICGDGTLPGETK